MVGGRSWFLEEENVYMLGTGAFEVFKRVKGGAGELFKVND